MGGTRFLNSRTSNTPRSKWKRSPNPPRPSRVTRAKTGVNLVRDLQGLWLLANESLISLTVLKQAAQALRDKPFEKALNEIENRNRRQLNWLMSRIRQAGPQAIVVPS